MSMGVRGQCTAVGQLEDDFGSKLAHAMLTGVEVVFVGHDMKGVDAGESL